MVGKGPHYAVGKNKTCDYAEKRLAVRQKEQGDG